MYHDSIAGVFRGDASPLEFSGNIELSDWAKIGMQLFVATKTHLTVLNCFYNYSCGAVV